MKNPPDGQRAELERIRRVADMLCSGHAALRDRYARKATALDLSILALTAWLSAIAFVAPRINVSLTPFGLDPQIWTGLLSVAALFLAIVQLRTDWKGRSDAHRRSLDVYAEAKREAGYILAKGEIEERAFIGVVERYNMASAVGIDIPEKEFLAQKRHHKMKVALSKYLDDHPGASILIVRTRLWYRDTFGKGDSRG
jgi:hypothetical protein